jgi:hypothetical protein
VGLVLDVLENELPKAVRSELVRPRQKA